MPEAPAQAQNRPLRVMISAGEISGEMYGAALVRELRSIFAPRQIEFFGLGGDKMLAEGVELVEHASRTGVIGFWEVAKRARFFTKLWKTLREMLSSRKPDMVLTIDYPGMNLKLAAAAKAQGIPAVHCVCPQVWAWHRERIPKIAAALNRLIAFFPFEPPLFDGTGLDVKFTGHPLVDQIAESMEEAGKPLPWGVGRKIAIFAGSRRNEVRRILPDVLAGAALAEKELGACSFILPVPSAERAADVRAVVNAAKLKPQSLAIVEGSSRQALAEADAAIVKSGTSTLEAAILDCPFAIAYRVSWTTYKIMKRLLTGVRFIGLVNIVPDKSVCKEFIQYDLTPEAITQELVSLCTDESRRADMKRDFADIREKLGGRGATERIAQLVAELLQR